MVGRTVALSVAAIAVIPFQAMISVDRFLIRTRNVRMFQDSVVKIFRRIMHVKISLTQLMFVAMKLFTAPRAMLA